MTESAVEKAARWNKPPPIVERIQAGLDAGIKNYVALMVHVFPVDHFPNAFRKPTRGGPPGCAMAFNAALRRMGLRCDFDTLRIAALGGKKK